ncbi:MAG: FAD-dependent oxidoreductase [Candidatus Lokiarchaeota archaeon]|nr:FAD-dependent oxidoreductase [Candidatus Lokiarchaeota archaeon]
MNLSNKVEKPVGYRPKVYTRDTLDCPIIADVDILIIGGSQSGVAAALSAKRALKSLNYNVHNSKVMLVEQNNYLGGQSVTNMVTQWEIHAFRLNAGKWQIKGVGMDMVEKIVSLGGSDKLWEDLISLNRKSDVEWPFLGGDHKICGEEALNLEAIKLGLLQMCDEQKIDLMLDTRAVAPIVKEINNPSLPQDSLSDLSESEEKKPITHQIDGIIVEYFSGRGAILAKQIIDASANGLVPWWVLGYEGCTVNPAKNRGLVQSYIWIGGVNMNKFLDWALNLPDDVFEYYPADKVQLRKHGKTGRLIWFKSQALGQPESVFDEAEEEEDLDIVLKSEVPIAGFYFKWVGTYPGHGMFAFDGPYYREDSLHANRWTSMHKRNLYGSWGMFRIARHMPGWENAYIARTCERMGLRTTRVPKGIYVIRGTDLKDHKEQPDAIGVGDWHDRSSEDDTGKWGYHIPLRALIPNTIDGLTFCARAVSFDPGAMNAHRGIGTTIVCGQGAGVASAVALVENNQPRYVDIKKVQAILRDQDVVLKIPSK